MAFPRSGCRQNRFLKKNSNNFCWILKPPAQKGSRYRMPDLRLAKQFQNCGMFLAIGFVGVTNCPVNWLNRANQFEDLRLALLGKNPS
jgi:hypothetical protein